MSAFDHDVFTIEQTSADLERLKKRDRAAAAFVRAHRAHHPSTQLYQPDKPGYVNRATYVAALHALLDCYPEGE